jgi:hypothetical protein
MHAGGMPAPAAGDQRVPGPAAGGPRVPCPAALAAARQHVSQSGGIASAGGGRLHHAVVAKAAGNKLGCVCKSNLKSDDAPASKGLNHGLALFKHTSIGCTRMLYNDTSMNSRYHFFSLIYCIANYFSLFFIIFGSFFIIFHYF